MKLAVSFLMIVLLSACSEDNNTNSVPEVVYTQIYGKLTGELNLAQSPYRVTRNIVVDSNSTLKINAGVELYFDENTQLIVKGELLVEGTNSQIVQFKSYNSSKKWSGIKLLVADKPAKFNFVKFRTFDRNQIHLIYPQVFQ